MIQMSINGREISSAKGQTVLEVASENSIYIPQLCFFTGLGSSRSVQPNQVVYRGQETIRNEHDIEYDGCNLCLVELGDSQELYHACDTPVESGMSVKTQTARIQQKRKEHLELILETHPHVCITCNLAEGCNRKLCSMGISEEARCCWKFGNCELQKVAAYIGFDEGVPYVSTNAPLIDDNPLFIRDYNLCIDCLRCVVACRKIAEREAIGFVNYIQRPIVGNTAATLKDSGCKFCLACVDVCPAGALREKQSKKKKSKLRLGIASPVFPPEKEERLLLDEDNLPQVPEVEGVYNLFDKDKALIQITGSENLRDDLAAELEKINTTTYFDYEENEMFTMRERQLIQQYMQKHGKMPPGNEEIDELF